MSERKGFTFRQLGRTRPAFSFLESKGDSSWTHPASSTGPRLDSLSNLDRVKHTSELGPDLHLTGSLLEKLTLKLKKTCLFSFRPFGLGLRARPEVAPVDWAPVPAATGQHHVPGSERSGPVLHDGGGLQTALPAVWRRALRSSRHLEIWWEQQEHDAVGGGWLWNKCGVTESRCNTWLWVLSTGDRVVIMIFFFFNFHLLSCCNEGALSAWRQQIRWVPVNDRIFDTRYES